MDDPQDITPLGFYNFRNQQKKFGIRIDDRRRHIYIIGKTGVGKTTLLENMTIADMRSGKGVAIVDPHGEFAEKMLDFVPENRLDDVIYFDPSDMEFPVAFNPMEQVGTEYRHLVASGLMGVFKKIWADAWSARMQYILNNTLLALLEYPGATLLGILRMFSNQDYRKQIVDNLKDPVIKAFWQDEFSKYSQRFETEALAAIQNKVGQFVSNPLVRNILGQPHSSLNMREIMDSGKIFICNLSKGKIGEDNSALLGAMIITRLQLAAMSRVDTAEHARRDFFLYVDEFQNFATESFANILSEARKYRLSLVLAHQYIGQLITGDSTSVRDAVFGNVGTIITFRVGAADAEFLEKEFMPEFLQNDLVNLAKANIYIKLMIDGVASRPFSAETLPPQKMPLTSNRDVIMQNSREHYGTPRATVEARIAGEWRSGASNAGAAKVGQRNEKRLSEVLGPGAPHVTVARTPAPGVRNMTVRDVAPHPAPDSVSVGPNRVEPRAIPQPAAPSARPSVPSPASSADPVRPAPPRERRQNVDIESLKRAIHQSLGTPARSRTAENAASESRVMEREEQPRNGAPVRPSVEEEAPRDSTLHLADLAKMPPPRKMDQTGPSPRRSGEIRPHSDHRSAEDHGSAGPSRSAPKERPSSRNIPPTHGKPEPKIDAEDLRRAMEDVHKKQAGDAPEA